MKSVVFLLLFCPTLLAAQIPQQKWYACKNDRECVPAKGPCETQTAVNSDFIKEFTAYATATDKRIECLKPGYAKKSFSFSAICYQNRCEAILRSPDRKGARPCSSDFDCETVRCPCKPHIISRRNKKKVQHCREAATRARCASVGDSLHLRLACLNGECVAQPE